MKEKIDNIFADIGLEDSEEMKIRSDLMSEVVHIIRNSGLTQREIALILGISGPKLSSLMTGKINDFSNDTLINYLTLLGCDVEVKLLSQFCGKLSKSVKRGKMKVKRAIKRPVKSLVKRLRRTKSNLRNDK